MCAYIECCEWEIYAVQFENLTKYTDSPQKQQHMPLNMQIQWIYQINCKKINKSSERFFEMLKWIGRNGFGSWSPLLHKNGYWFSDTHRNVCAFKSKCAKKILGMKLNGRYYVILCSNKAKPKGTTCWFVFPKKTRNTNVTCKRLMCSF